MPATAELIAGTCSVLLRISAFAFLRWIPGHHFPPVIITAVAIYLACVWGNADAFGPRRPALHDLFPRLLGRPKGEENAVEESDDVDDHDQPALYHDEKSFLKIVLLGIPSWRHPQWSFTTIAINLLLALCTLDLVLRGPLLHPAEDLTFSRVGYVDASSARILVREPHPTQLPLYVYLDAGAANATSRTTTHTIHHLGTETDFTYPILFQHLKASTKYTYALSNGLSGSFTTAASPHSDAAHSLTFLTSSCIKANFPYRARAHALAIHGFRHLSHVLSAVPTPVSFMLFLGDFIYVDVPLRLSSSLAHYRAEYRRVYASPSWAWSGLQSLPWLHTLDDHEIANDWSAGNDTAPFPAASDPFIHYHVAVNPPVPPGSPTGPETNTTYFQFSNGPASFFMLDTRRYRTHPEPASASAAASSGVVSRPAPLASSVTTHAHTMLGEGQLAALLKYLATSEPGHVHWKIVASSVPFTKNWRFGTSDTWGGFLHERAVILDAMHAAERNLGVRIVILSGDRHEFAAIRFPPRVADSEFDVTPHAGPHEFSVGPLSMFYLPFRTFRQIDAEDVAIKYLPDGNSKVGAVQIEPLTGEQSKSLLRYSLYVDGHPAWEYTLTSPSPIAGVRRQETRRWWPWKE